MNSLLKIATQAHGGLDRWNQLSSLTASVLVTGALWQTKGKPNILKDVHLELTLHLERLVTHFVGQDKRFFLTRSRVAIEDEQGKTLDGRNDPGTAFDGQSFETPWDELQIAYFNSYGPLDLPDHSVSLRPSCIHHGGDAPLARRRRRMAAAKGHFSINNRQPLPGTNLVRRPRRIVAEARIRRRCDGRGQGRSTSPEDRVSTPSSFLPAPARRMPWYPAIERLRPSC
jgi:hypothetical protein